MPGDDVVAAELVELVVSGEVVGLGLVLGDVYSGSVLTGGELVVVDGEL